MGLALLTWQELILTSDAVTPNTVKSIAPTLASSAAGGLTFIGTVATMVCAAPHGLLNQTVANIDGASDAGYNQYARITVLSATTFTYQLDPANLPAASPDVGTATVSTLKVRSAIITADTANAGGTSVSFGPNKTSPTLTTSPHLGPGQSWSLDAVTGSQRAGFHGCIDLAQWYFAGSATSLNASVWYVL